MKWGGHEKKRCRCWNSMRQCRSECEGLLTLNFIETIIPHMVTVWNTTFSERSILWEGQFWLVYPSRNYACTSKRKKITLYYCVLLFLIYFHAAICFIMLASNKCFISGLKSPNMTSNILAFLCLNWSMHYHHLLVNLLVLATDIELLILI